MSVNSMRGENTIHRRPSAHGMGMVLLLCNASLAGVAVLSLCVARVFGSIFNSFPTQMHRKRFDPPSAWRSANSSKIP